MKRKRKGLKKLFIFFPLVAFLTTISVGFSSWITIFSMTKTTRDINTNVGSLNVNQSIVLDSTECKEWVSNNGVISHAWKSNGYLMGFIKLNENNKHVEQITITFRYKVNNSMYKFISSNGQRRFRIKGELKISGLNKFYNLMDIAASNFMKFTCEGTPKEGDLDFSTVSYLLLKPLTSPQLDPKTNLMYQVGSYTTNEITNLTPTNQFSYIKQTLTFDNFAEMLDPGASLFIENKITLY